MNVIQQNCDTHPTLEEAQDALAGLSHLPGFVMGYVDDKENRPVAFFTDAFPQGSIQRGQRRRTLVFAVRPAAEEISLAPIFDAINNGKDMLKR